MANQRLWMTRDEVQDSLRVSLRTVDRLIKSGELMIVKVGRSVRIPTSSFEACIARVSERRGGW